MSPHGLIGQSFNFEKEVFEKQMIIKTNYLKTESQAEGAIEGSYLDYIVEDLDTHKFKYTRFNPIRTKIKTKLYIQMNYILRVWKSFSLYLWTFFCSPRTKQHLLKQIRIVILILGLFCQYFSYFWKYFQVIPFFLVLDPTSVFELVHYRKKTLSFFTKSLLFFHAFKSWW